ncbi:membrane protein FxsA [Halogeometricum sp. S1BR25-6]|uniref:Membrane protein FxsA n=1 Tax=Halogeometricum salsisoli TaxID=2950536 RepID=A0ABU2GFU2_9EURY|nr:FxsA family protein [Halogeometricum sp. S1BR25-6]MDS0299681.1 membrane protein FxsA [Halogeometricum sp. S1BR25-6]
MQTRWVIAALLAIPLLDTLLLIPLSGFIGFTSTVLLVVLTGLVGMLLVRAEGRHTLSKLQQKVATGALPTNELLDGGLLIAAGAFLLTPGVVTDLLGFVLALPVTRYPLREALKRFVVRPYLEKQTGGFFSGDVWVGGFPDDDVVNLDPENYGRPDDDNS